MTAQANVNVNVASKAVPWQIKSVVAEFNSAAWLANLGRPGVWEVKKGK